MRGYSFAVRAKFSSAMKAGTRELMTSTERASLLVDFDHTRERLQRMITGLSRAQLEYREAPSRWSVAENLEHIIISEQLILAFVEKALREPPDGSTRGEWDGRDAHGSMAH